MQIKIHKMGVSEEVQALVFEKAPDLIKSDRDCLPLYPGMDLCKTERKGSVYAIFTFEGTDLFLTAHND